MSFSLSAGTGGQMSEPPLGLRRVLITGGGTGIGKAIVDAVLARGGKVAIVGRRVDVLKKLEARAPGQIVAMPCDITLEESRTGLLERAYDALGGLDGFVHAAGAVMHEPFGNILEDSLREQIEVNLVAPLRLGEEALQVLEDGGSMLFLSSTLAIRPTATSAVYSATKAAQTSMMRALALAGAPRKVRANTISPGVVDTGMVRALRLPSNAGTPNPADMRAKIDAQLEGLRVLHPLGRLGTPEDIAQMAMQLLGAAWMTGSDVVLDGGLLVRD